MSVAIEDVVRLIEDIAPRQLAYEWDNTGLLLRCSSNISAVMVALDVTDAVVDEALDEECDMILSHHPLIFEPMKALSNQNVTQALVMRLIRENISVYSAHTSFDRAPGGINDLLAQKLGLTDVFVANSDGEDLMRVGNLPKTMDTGELAEYVKKCIGIKHLMTSDAHYDSIGKVAVVGGSGGSMLEAAAKSGAKALITGEAKHSHHIEAMMRGLPIIEAGHYATECLFVDGAFLSLQVRLNEVQLHLGLKRATRQNAPCKAK